MAETRFTPGPWGVCFPPTRFNPEIWAGGMKIATTSGCARFDYANAHLIAAAPETYCTAEDFADEAACVLAGEFGRDWSERFGPLFDKLCSLREALAKVRGEV